MSEKISRERIVFVGFEVVDPSLMDASSKDIFLRRREAIRLRLDGNTGKEIRKVTGIQESEVTRLFKRYTTLNDKGIYSGEAGLIPGYRINPYQRVKPPEAKASEGQGGLSGVLSYTLAKYPGLVVKFESEVLRRSIKFGHGAKFRKKGLCQVFYDICKSEGVGSGEWPLNQPRGARKTIGKYIDEILNNDFSRAALVSGGRVALTHSKVGTGFIPLLEDFDVYDFIEIDSWHMDAFFVLNISGDKRVKTKDVISRIWMIAAVCRRSNAVLAIKFVFSSEIRSQDLMDLICDAYAGTWSPRTALNVRDLKYTASAGMPCYSVPALRHHSWGAVCLDNAMQHHATKIYELALHTLGFAINYGPLEQPARRSKVEGLFRRIATNVIHQISSTTGSSPQDGRAESPEKAAVYYQIDVDDALEVMDVFAANYNGIPQGGLNKASSPLEILCAYSLDKEVILPKSNEIYLNSICLGSSTVQARVTGNVAKGIRPRIKLDQALYTSPDLANSPHLIGTSLLVRINPHDYRTVEAYLPEGIYFGILNVEAAWRNIKHSVTTRRLVNRAQAKKEFEIMEGENPILAWKRHLIANSSVKNNLELARLNGDLESKSVRTQFEPSDEIPDHTRKSTSERWKNLDILR
uniref:Integrase catalytic domain-containing protein n=1 Tax=Ectopseudomonas mendocina (strain ymp) TaxID=399739 RepID=A4XUJ6_ECTM1|nr:helix-turn-helix domain-containing protein [Pseudomonas chengduensis]